ncbi:hypothetical protein PLICRDRAFT_175035 [Plicaturopsis crispa FD-325 SS-3]|nr:hypothetical protein PLICRDRAFT_175035 [Plicaturopsis crispa FD-325 SS-3]
MHAHHNYATASRTFARRYLFVVLSYSTTTTTSSSVCALSLAPAPTSSSTPTTTTASTPTSTSTPPPLPATSTTSAPAPCPHPHRRVDARTHLRDRLHARPLAITSTAPPRALQPAHPAIGGCGGKARSVGRVRARAGATVAEHDGVCPVVWQPGFASANRQGIGTARSAHRRQRARGHCALSFVVVCAVAFSTHRAQTNTGRGSAKRQGQRRTRGTMPLRSTHVLPARATPTPPLSASSARRAHPFRAPRPWPRCVPSAHAHALHTHQGPPHTPSGCVHPHTLPAHPSAACTRTRTPSAHAHPHRAPPHPSSTPMAHAPALRARASPPRISTPFAPSAHPPGPRVPPTRTPSAHAHPLRAPSALARALRASPCPPRTPSAYSHALPLRARARPPRPRRAGFF